MARALAMLILSVFTLSQLAGAVSGLGAGSGNWRNPKDTKGMCTPDNKDEVYYKSGYCKAAYESFVKDGCVKNALEELRLRYLKGTGDPSAAAKVGNKEPVSIGFSCASRAGAGQQKYLDEIAKDPKRFAFFMMQFISLVVIQESDWDVKNNGNGLLNLTKAQMDDKQYACGCDIANSESRGGDITGPSPGPIDGHHSIQCGAYMAIHHALKDNTLFGDTGQRPSGSTSSTTGATTSSTQNPQDGRQGAARIFKSLQRPPGANPQATNERFKQIEEKMKNYCERYAHSKTNTWQRELTDDVGLPDAQR